MTGVMTRTAVILTTYNRPTLVADAIASVLEQTDSSWRLYIMDDGSDEATRAAIANAIGGHESMVVETTSAGRVLHQNYSDTARTEWPEIIWWQGCGRTLEERRSCISYSMTINVALNYLLQDEQYVAYLVDDDFLYPESIQARVDFLQENPDVHVCYGRMRSIQYTGTDTFNTWATAGRPTAGRAYPRPTGRREFIHNGKAAKVYFENGETDPQTGLDYVDEAIWLPTPLTYGVDGQTDHNQVMHRRECLTTCRQWPDGARCGGKQYWGEDNKWGVGDAAFFTLLGEAHQFYPMDAWVVSKRFHARSIGISEGPVRE